MRIPVTWLVEHLEFDETPTPDELAEAFTRIGIEVEEVSPLGPVTGPIVAGRVVEIEELTEFKKPIRFCRVEVGPEQVNEIICGATNFVEGDSVVVALPGAVLPGGFTITARKTYGRTSNGMICAADELGIGDDHSGILVLPTGTSQPGDDALELLGLNDTVIEVAPTPDRGYAFSVRGLAREIACALEVPFGDPGVVEVPEPEGEAWPVHIEDRTGCSRFVARRVSGVDPTAPTPWWMRRRLMLAGIRSISLPVDVTNYVMLELGQPLHSFDASALQGGMVVRRALPGEKLTTLDDAVRALDPDDIVIADDSGVISLAGVMGGASTEVRDSSTDILLEAANWDPASIARTVRRHKLPVRGREAVRARRRPRTGAGRAGAGREAAQPLRRGQHQAGPDRRRFAHAARAGVDADRPAGPHRGRPLRAWRHGAPARPDRLPGLGHHVRRRPDDRHGRAADVALRPRAARRPGGGGAAAGGLRHDSLRAAARSRRSRPDRAAAPPPHRVAHAGRGRLRRGEAVPVHRPVGVRRVRAAG